jgi:WD40 repeat protein
MSEPSVERDPFEVVAEAFLARYRAGERPSITEYAARHPDLAEQIRRLLPALVMVEQDLSVDVSPVPAARDATERKSRRLGDYRILREIGRGGMGVVYEAEQLSLGRRVALKVLPPHISHDHRALERFRHEAKAAARLHHTNIVPVFEVGQDGATAYFAMQFIQGQGLEQVILELARQRDAGRNDGTVDLGPSVVAGATVAPQSALGPVAESLLAGRLSAARAEPVSGDPLAATEPLDVDATSARVAASTEWDGSVPSSPASPESGVPPGGEQITTKALAGGKRLYFRSVAQIGRQAAEGLAYAHARGIIPRDIKPSNLLLDHAGVVWIADFGLAKAEEDDLTDTGDILGTPRYMAPERFHGEGDTRADIYGLGLTLYELLTLQPAYDTSNRLKLIERIKSEDPVRFRSLDGRIPRDLETIVLKAIAKAPERRYPTAKAMAEDLRRFLADEPILARRASAVERYWRWARRHPTIAILGGVLTVVLVLATAGSLLAARRFRDQAVVQRHLADERETARQKASHAEEEVKRANAHLLSVQDVLRTTLYATRTNLALEAFEANDLVRFRTLLEQCKPRGDEPDLRGWEWNYLEGLGHEERLTFRGHDKAVYKVAISRDGRLAASSQEGGTVKLWDTTSGEVRHSLVPGKPVGSLGPWSGAVTGMAFRPDGLRLAAAGADRFVRIWDTATGQPLLSFTVTSGDVLSLDFSPDGHRLAVASTTHTLRVIDADDGHVMCETMGHGGPVTGVAFSPDGKVLASCSNDQTVKLWDASTGKSLRVLKGHTDFVTGVAFSPDGRTLASAGGDGTIRLWDVASGAPLQVRRDHSIAVSALAFSPDGRTLAYGGDDRAVKLLNAATLEPLRTFRGHTEAVTAVCFAPDGHTLASASTDRTAKIWDLEQPIQPLTLTEPTARRYDEGVFCVAFSADGRTLVSGHGDSEHSIKVWNVDGHLVRVLKGHGHRVLGVAFSPDGKIMASSSEDGTTILWDPATWTPLRTLDGHSGAISQTVFSPDGRTIATPSRDDTVLVWDVATAALRLTFDGHRHSVMSAAFSPDLPTIASVDRGGSLLFWDSQSREIRRRFSTGNPFLCVAFSRDGRNVVAGDSAGRLWWCDSSTGQPIRTLPGHEGAVRKLAFSPDGRRLVSCGADRRLKLWDISSGQMLLMLKGHARDVNDVAFSPDGRRIASASSDRSVKVWNASPLDRR